MTCKVRGLGMINALGRGALPSVTAAMAGISQYTETELLNPEGIPLRFALVPDEILPVIDVARLSRPGVRYERMMRLAVGALDECVGSTEVEHPLPLFLALPERRPGRDYPALEPFLKELSGFTGDVLDLSNSRIFPYGRSAGFTAMASAMALLENRNDAGGSTRGGAIKRVLVGGVDSYVDASLLGIMDKQNRLLLENTADGFVPGEGAAFLMLEMSSKGRILIHTPVTASEPGHCYSDEICEGVGLSGAIGQAIQQAGSPGIGTVFCSLNGEGVFAKEWGLSAIRVSTLFKDGLQIEHPAEYYGDIGAATVPSLYINALIGRAKDRVDGAVLIWAASDFEHRGAGILV
ncbi:MAG: hypothetical protein CSB48_03565 [Proteobacteria bacterium]|nr:MAG: hypothetical protein CSB48_03565 [Pseudomonadota bacterium]